MLRWSLLLLLGRARGGRYSGGYYSGSSSKGYYSDSYTPIGFYDFKYSEDYYYSVVSKYDCSCSSDDDCFSGGYSVDGRCGCRERATTLCQAQRAAPPALHIRYNCCRRQIVV